MDFSVEHGYRYLRILAGTKSQCANSNCLTRGFTPLLQKQVLQRVSAALGAGLSFARRLRKRVPTRIPENVNDGYDDVLRRLMRASTSAMLFEARCDTHLCLNEGFTL